MGIDANVYDMIDTVLTGLDMPHAAVEMSDLPPLHVIYHKVSDVFFNFADGKPTARRVVMGLSVFCKRELAAQKEDACTKIRAALLAAGWKVWDGGSDIPRERDSPFVGTNMEAAVELFGGFI